MLATILRRRVPDPQTHLLQSAIARSFSATSKPLSQRRSFVASPDSVSQQKVKFRSSDDADSVLNLLANHGFSETHISRIVRIYPTILQCKAQTNLLPKLHFFRFRVGLSDEDLVRVLSSTPSLLGASLEGHLIPCFRFFNDVVGLDEKQVRVALRRRPRSFLYNVVKSVAPNIALLRELRVPQSSISYLVTNLSKRAFIQHSRFVKVVEEALNMGFDPSELTFIVSVHILSAMTESKWEAKFDLYGRFGWSREHALEAFRRSPRIMEVSEEKVMQVMDFLVNKMGWSSAPCDIIREPKALLYSFEKRIVPRCYVVHILKLKGLVKHDLALASFLPLVEKSFLQRFVTRFQDSAPQLLSLYDRTRMQN